MHLLSVLAMGTTCLLLVGPQVPGRGASADQSSQSERCINGRDNPELIPPDVAWTMFLLHMKNLTLDPASGRHTPTRTHGLARYSLHVTDEEATTIVEHALRFADRYESVMRPLDAEHEGKQTFTPERRKAIRSQASQVAIEARNDLMAALSPQGRAAVERYLRDVVVPSISMPADR